MEFKSITFYACDQLSGESTKTILRKKVFSRKQSKTTQCPFKDIQNESYSYSIRATPISIETLPTTPMFISKLSNFYQGMRCLTARDSIKIQKVKGKQVGKRIKLIKPPHAGGQSFKMKTKISLLK